MYSSRRVYRPTSEGASKLSGLYPGMGQDVSYMNGLTDCFHETFPPWNQKQKAKSSIEASFINH